MTKQIQAARSLAYELRRRYGALSAAELARLNGIEIVTARWQVAEGRLLYLGECTRKPLRIVLNEAALELAAQPMFLRELVIAHELGHLLLPRPSVFAAAKATEAAAHAFARAWTGQSGMELHGIFSGH